jgi:hypothetical protein
MMRVNIIVLFLILGAKYPVSPLSKMLAVVYFLQMSFSMLKKFSYIPVLFGLIQKDAGFCQMLFSVSIEMIMWILFFVPVIWYIILSYGC